MVRMHSYAKADQGQNIKEYFLRNITLLLLSFLIG